MAKINLLPWREERRKEQTKDFVSKLVLIVIFAGSITFAGFTHVDNLLTDQKNRLKFLEDETATLQTQLKEITILENTKKKLLSRMNVVQSLQGRRPMVVHMFHEISHTIPTGTHLTKVIQKDNKIQVNGEADSNAGVSEYMRNIENSEWFLEPKLEFIKTDPVSRNSIFKLNIALTTPQKNSE